MDNQPQRGRTHYARKRIRVMTNKILFKSISGRWVLNIPFGRVDGFRRVIVIGRGRLLKNGHFNNWLPCNYFLVLKHDGETRKVKS